MGFFEFQDDYKVLQRQGKIRNDESPEEFYARTLQTLRTLDVPPRQRGVMEERYHSQLQWHRSNTPYLKVYPGIAGYLAKVSIDIPCEQVKLPFPAFEVRLPDQDNPFQEADNTPALRCLFISYTISGDMHVCMDFGDTEHGLSLYFEQIFPLEPGTTVEDQLHRIMQNDASVSQLEQLSSLLQNRDARYMPSQSFRQAIMALAISSCFFMTGDHQVVCPDVPNRLVERFHKARSAKNQAEINAILKKAKKSGHDGWTVGREVKLPRDIVLHHQDARKEGKSWELQWAHVRSACWRNQPIGPRNDPEYKRIFIMPTVVRSDRPFKPGAIGFALTDDLIPVKHR